MLAGLLPRVRDIRRFGAASLDLCFAAEGRVDAYYEKGLNAWDHAAGGLVATEAGLLVTGLRGARARARDGAGRATRPSSRPARPLVALDADRRPVTAGQPDVAGTGRRRRVADLRMDWLTSVVVPSFVDPAPMVTSTTSSVRLRSNAYSAFTRK